MIGEEASECRNKDYKKYRQYHSRKHNRIANLEDIFYRAMDSSDPIISTMSLEKRIQKRRKLPQEVINLFKVNLFKIPSNPNTEDEIFDEDISGLPDTFTFLNDI